MHESLQWVVWSCTICRLPRYSTEWWANQYWCHHGKKENTGTELVPRYSPFNPTEENWYGHDANE